MTKTTPAATLLAGGCHDHDRHRQLLEKETCDHSVTQNGRCRLCGACVAECREIKRLRAERDAAFAELKLRDGR